MFAPSLIALLVPSLVAAPRPACDPPLPLPGQTVTWTASLNPVRICTDTEIPSGGVVEMDPGVMLVVDAGVSLTVSGELRGLGTAAAPVSMGGAGDVLANGRVTLTHARLEVDVTAGSRGFVALSHGSVADGAHLATFARDALVSLEDVTIDAGQPSAFATLALRDVRFLAPTSTVLWSNYVLADGVTIRGRGLDLTIGHQPRLLSDVDVLGAGSSPAITVGGGGIEVGTNVLVDGDCELSGARVPVLLRVGGLHPESVLPASGNTLDRIELGVGAGSGVSDLPNLAVPYYAPDDVSLGGRMRAGPGAVFEFEAFGGFLLRGGFFDDTPLLRGTPAQQLRIRQATPGDETAGVALFNGIVEHVEVDGGRIGSISGFNAIRECTVRGASVGIFGDASGFGTVSGCHVLDNAVGVEDDPTSFQTLDLRGTERANLFEGNELAARNNASAAGNAGPFPAQDNWWGDPTGPFSSFLNPAGLGDPIGFGVEARPWRIERPDLSDAPPVVELTHPFLLAEPGDWIWVTWSVEDDGALVSQRIQMDVSGGGQFEWVTLVDDLGPTVRSSFVQIPVVGLHPDARSNLLRVEAVDDAGNVGRMDVTLQVPVMSRPDGTVSFLTDVSQGFVPGEEVQICYDALGIAAGNVRVYLVMDTEENTLLWGPNGNAGLGTCTFSTLRMPLVSVDRARLALFSDGTGNDNDWYFSEPFAVRPGAGFPDAPPSVAMTSPSSGARFRGGENVPLAWVASDDEGLREIRVQVSLNDGRAWSTVATLPGSATSHALRIPSLGTMLEDVRVRIVAVDHRFQASTDGDERTFALDPGERRDPPRSGRPPERPRGIVTAR